MSGKGLLELDIPAYVPWRVTDSGGPLAAVAEGGGGVASRSMPLRADRAVPGLIVKIGNYPLHHGGVGAIRSLGRLGVPMYALTEDRWTPAAVSRYLRRAFVRPTTGRECRPG